jgi:hypothetical protein
MITNLQYIYLDNLCALPSGRAKLNKDLICQQLGHALCMCVSCHEEGFMELTELYPIQIQLQEANGGMAALAPGPSGG